MFSAIENDTCEPLVPVPAAAAISPVGCSSTIISTIFVCSEEPSFTAVSTFPNIFLLFSLFIDFLNKISLYGSPSSMIKEFLITFSLVRYNF